MRVPHRLLIAALLVGVAVPAVAQDPEARAERRARVRVEPYFSYPLDGHVRLRATRDRMRMVERALERAGEVRVHALERAGEVRAHALSRVRGRLDRAERVRVEARSHQLRGLELSRERGLLTRERMADRWRGELDRSMVARERAMDRVRDRLDRVRVEQRLSQRRRWRTI
jgi:hypothetical protein